MIDFKKWEMSGTSVGCSQPRPCSGRLTLSRCRNRSATDNVVLIDVDSDTFDNVIIIDVPESLQNNFRGTSVLRNDKKDQWATVICLDDDNDDAFNGAKVDRNLSNGASSSKKSSSASGKFASSSNAVADDCQFICENVSPVKLSKCKRTYSGEGFNRNQYGLGAETESGPSNGDYLDCELMEGPFGRLWEQWEKASLKRKCDNRNCQYAVEDPGKFIETDEFRISLVEELASGQQALQIQFEEAQNLQRLQKRKNAESMRLQDMERRQKQRVEEIRETKKKDEESMNLKEVIRTAVIKELKQLELTCHDMASVLQALGILVSVVGQQPSLDEVRLAYKRALLTFHPDRASSCDVRQQVEAEEKFKLICRMKAKFPPT